MEDRCRSGIPLSRFPRWRDRLDVEGRWESGRQQVGQTVRLAATTAVESVAAARLEGGSDCRGERCGTEGKWRKSAGGWVVVGGVESDEGSL